MATLWNDLRHAARLLVRRPGLTLATLLVLGLGLGATAALFTLVNGLLFKPLPGIEEPERLVLVGRTQGGEGFDTFGYVDYRELRDRVESLSGLAATHTRGAELRHGADSRRVTASLVSGDYFELLGTRAAAGRLLAPGDTERPGEPPVAVLGHELAETLFGSPAAAVGGTVGLNGVPLQVVGVAARGFRGHFLLAGIEAWVPVTLAAQVRPAPFDLLSAREAVWLQIFGRLAPGASPARAEVELQGLMSGLVTAYPEAYEGRGVAVVEGVGLAPMAREYVRSLSWKLLGAVLLVLAVVCANVANLQLAQVTDRGRELGVRLALGARRRTLIRQVLTESLLLSLAGGALGLLVASWSGGLLRLVVAASDLAGAEGILDLAPDGRVLGFGLALAAAVGMLAGVVPALHATGAGAEAQLRQGATPRAGGRSRARDALVVAQIVLSLVLLTAAGVYVRSLDELRRIEPGFDADRVWTAGLRVEGEGSEDQVRARLERVLEVAERVPGVEAAAVGEPAPLAGSRMSTILSVPGWQPPADADGFEVDLRDVSPGYFRTLGVELVQGRLFAPSDRPAGEPVAIVNETMARRFWPGRSPLGESFSETGGGQTYRVVGVVSDMKYLDLTEEPRRHFYRPVAQNPHPETILHVRAASGDPRAVGLRVRQALAEEAPGVLLFGDRTLSEQLDLSIGTVRVVSSLLGLFGALALVLAAVGLAGTLLYYVRSHRHEIGVRMAIGADASRVVRLVVGRGLRRVALGVALGAPAALAAARALESELYGVDPGDPWTLAGVAAVLFAVALVAALPAASRASRAEPAQVLRQE
jgi:putative ABC transport system permease protein